MTTPFGLRGLALAVAFALATAVSAAAPAAQPVDAEVTGDDFELELVSGGFTSPVHLEVAPGDDRLYVVDQVGVISILDPTAADAQPQPFLDLRDRIVELRPGFDERGLLGLAFHPDYEENGRLFVHYSAPLRTGALAALNHTGTISEFTVTDGDTVDLDSERVILEVDQPQFNHNGGKISFGPDGYLYIALGDGGGSHDTGAFHPPLGNGQDVSTLLGNILRIDVDTEEDGRAYGIPADNPFADTDVVLTEDFEDVDWSRGDPRPEIWAWGFRNPYRFSFDRESGEMWVADVGQHLWEEVNVVTEPGNYGWNIMEGTHPFDPEDPRQVLTTGPTDGPMGEQLELPVLEYPNVSEFAEDGIGIAVIGGYVYRGAATPDLQGLYVFGDWSQSFGQPSGYLLVARPGASPDDVWEIIVERELDQFVLGFGEGADGELYLLTSESTGPTGQTGQVWRITQTAD